MKIVIDTREQMPFDFSAFEDCEAIRGTLNSGDYSVYGFVSEIAVERKSVDDLIGCLTHDRERFTAELQRLRGYASALLVVEAPFYTFQHYAELSFTRLFCRFTGGRGFCHLFLSAALPPA